MGQNAVYIVPTAGQERTRLPLGGSAEDTENNDLTGTRFSDSLCRGYPQPLHAANNGDRGGNCEPLTNFILHRPFDTKELHAAWDDDEVRAVMKVLGDQDQTTTALFSRFQNGEQVAQLAPLDWARESNDLAKKDVYMKFNLPNHTAPPGTCDPTIQRLNEKVNVTQEYLDGNVADVETQLLRAGIRLSRIINEICVGNGCVANPRPHR